MENQKSFYSGLLFKCSIDKENPNCPFAEIRTKKIVERIDYYNKINYDKFLKLMEFHLSCIERKNDK